MNKIEVSLAECAKKGYYLCGHCSKISHVGDYHEEEDGPPRCLHCKKISFMTWHPPVLEDDMPEQCKDGACQLLEQALRTIAAIILVILFLIPAPARAMDRFAALSMLESGNNDFAIGTNGEISRYQIKPDVWKAWSKPITPDGWHVHWQHKPDPTNRKDALGVAFLVITYRVYKFETSHHLPTLGETNEQWYLLWNCPNDVDHPSPREAARARRFANLCHRP